MGKETVIFRDTREKVDKEKRIRPEGGSSSFKKFDRRREAPVKKNISKKDSDKARRFKAHTKAHERIQKKSSDDKNLALKKLQKGNASIVERKAIILKDIKERREANNKQDDEWQDVDEHEKEVYATTGYFDVPEEEAHISKHDQNLLLQMEQSYKPQEIGGVEGGKNLADIIMQKLATGDYIDGDKMDQSEMSTSKSNLDPKIIAAYNKVGIVMRSFKSGKLPKAFKIIPQT